MIFLDGRYKKLQSRMNQTCGCNGKKTSLKDILVGIRQFLQSVLQFLDAKETALAKENLTLIDHLLENMDGVDHDVATALKGLKSVLESYVNNSIDEADAREALIRTRTALEEAVSQKYSEPLEGASGVSW